MGFFQRLFRTPEERLTLGEMGASLVRISHPASSLRLLVPEDLPTEKQGDAFLALASLYLFAWIRASQSEAMQSEAMQLAHATEQEIYDSFASALVVEYVQRFGASDDADSVLHDITSRAHGLIGVWNENEGNAPAPHWYVAKEVWHMIEKDRDRPNPARIEALSKMLSEVSIAFLQYALDVREYIHRA